jgi:hypothetical protein
LLIVQANRLKTRIVTHPAAGACLLTSFGALIVGKWYPVRSPPALHRAAALNEVVVKALTACLAT